MLTNLTFNEMIERFGEISAYANLEHIERAAGISPRQMTGIEPEARLIKALHTQDAMNQSILLAA